MSHDIKAEELQNKAEKKARRKQSKKEGRAAKDLHDSDKPVPVDAEPENELKTEKRERRKEKKRKREEDAEPEGTKSLKKSKASIEPIISPITIPSEIHEHETKEKRSKNLKKRKAADKEADGSFALERTEEKSKKEKLSKKAKKHEKNVPAVQIAAAISCKKALDEIPSDIPGQDFISLEDTPKQTNGDSKSEKRKKKAKKGKKASEEPAQDVHGNEAVPQDEALDETVENPPNGKKSRFVVFVGNLPFTASKEDIQKHFEKINPTDVRIMTDKQTKKPKGFAFVEFDRFDRMETCLKKYQHSLFGEGKKARKINVELTAGGGGNNESRKAKIQAKNDKLHDERQREREKREELEAKQQDRKQKKEAKQKKDAKETTNDAAKSGAPADENGGIHPARLAMMNKPATPGKPYGRTRY